MKRRHKQQVTKRETKTKYLYLFYKNYLLVNFKLQIIVNTPEKKLGINKNLK